MRPILRIDGVEEVELVVVVVDVGEGDDEHVLGDIDVGIRSTRLKRMLNFSTKFIRMFARAIRDGDASLGAEAQT